MAPAMTLCGTLPTSEQRRNPSGRQTMRHPPTDAGLRAGALQGGSRVMLVLLVLLTGDWAHAQTPPQWRLSGESRVRFESLHHQFRAGFRGSDQALAMRTLLLVERQAAPLTLGLELLDARHALDDDGSFLSATGQVATADFLQAYGRIDLELDQDHHLALTLGRQTVHIGSGRQIERVDYANVISNYTGLHAVWSRDTDRLHFLLIAPVAKLPADFASLRRNRLELDRTQWNRRIAALHWIRQDVWADRLPGLQAEAFIYALDEDDSRRFATPNRHYLTPGLRLYTAPAPASLDYEIEAAWRIGNRRLTDRRDDVAPLRVRARTLHAHVGWTFPGWWQARIGVDYDYASGDRDPRDDRFDQYERLFGSRRTDLGNTGIHGPLTPANINAPGLRIEGRPGPDTDFRLAVKRARLSSSRDAWVVARVRDPSGNSGRVIGTSTDLRVRHWLIRDSLRIEVGASYLDRGRFARVAPNATREGDPRFGYVQLTWSF